MLFAVFFLALLCASGVRSFSLSSLLKKEVPRDTQRLCAALYKLPQVPELFGEARLLAESSAVCGKSHFWVWERINPMEIADLIAMDLRVQDTAEVMQEQEKRAEIERKEATVERKRHLMVNLYKRWSQKSFKCLAANLWTHDIRAQSVPIIRKNAIPVMTEKMCTLNPVRIFFEGNDSLGLPGWRVLVYSTFKERLFMTAFLRISWNENDRILSERRLQKIPLLVWERINPVEIADLIHRVQETTRVMQEQEKSGNGEGKGYRCKKRPIQGQFVQELESKKI
jgi:hypothetical protein